MSMKYVLLLNGPNLDMLGTREPEIYGRQTLEALEEAARQYGAQRGLAVTTLQSNSEAELINRIHSAANLYDGIVYNPGAHTHYSYALRDAIASIDIPVVEVHISDVSKREPFRNISVIAPACTAQVKGLGFDGYLRALDILANHSTFVRLEEGFEKRYDTSQHIIIAGVSPEKRPETRRAPKPLTEAQAAQQPEAPAMAQPEQAPVRQSAQQPAQTLEAKQAALDPRKPQPIELATAAQTAQAASQADIPATVGQVAATPAAASMAPIQAPTSTAAAATAAPEDTATAATAAQNPTPAAKAAEADPDDGRNFAAAYAQQIAASSNSQTSADRQAQVRRMCGQLGLGALLVRDTSNIRWITAIDGVFDDEPAHALLIDDARAMLHTDTRYSNAIREAIRQEGLPLAVDDRRASHAQFAKDMLAPANALYPGIVGIEDSISYAEFAKTVEAFGADGLMSTTDVVCGLRAVKSGSELSRLLAAQAVTDAAFAHIVRFIRPGMTEREVQLELDWYMLHHGAEGLAFSSIVATGANGADPHAIPGDAKLEAGQCVVMDFGAKAYGYCSDMTRTIFLGQPDAKMKSAWEVLRRANETVEAALRPGITGKQAHEMAERVLAEGGFGGKMGHGLGHGVGIDVHELPVLNSRNDEALAVGNVVTVEPGIYLPGEFGMRLEDCGVITQTGYEVFSRIGHDMIVL